MRRLAAHIALLLVFCIGFQPFAQAMGGRCMAGGDPMVSAVQGMDHDAHAGHQMQGMSEHQEHQTTAVADSAADRCHCGSSCVMPGCIGVAAVIATTVFPQWFAQFPDTYSSRQEAPQPRAAHGLDLIRPPSRS